MTIVLQWLVEHAWVFYAACAIGVVVYLVRALAAQRERSLSLFTLERETATTHVVQAWAMVLVFVAIGAAILVGTTFILPNLSTRDQETPLSTSTPSSGVEAPTLLPSSTIEPLVSTLTATVASAPVPTTPPEPTEIPTLAPTDTPVAGASGAVNVRFGDFAELVGYGLPAAQFSAAEPLPLTIYWKGLGGTSPADYVVFTHLLAEDGHLIAQHDGAPANGSRPTSGWTAGEVIEDFHPMAFQDTGYTGTARIAVGLYDPTTGRVTSQTGGDHVVLPVTIAIVP